MSAKKKNARELQKEISKARGPSHMVLKTAKKGRNKEEHPEVLDEPGTRNLSTASTRPASRETVSETPINRNHPQSMQTEKSEARTAPDEAPKPEWLIDLRKRLENKELLASISPTPLADKPFPETSGLNWMTRRDLLTDWRPIPLEVLVKCGQGQFVLMKHFNRVAPDKSELLQHASIQVMDHAWETLYLLDIALVRKVSRPRRNVRIDSLR